jgi:hypothetical protein
MKARFLEGWHMVMVPSKMPSKYIQGSGKTIKETVEVSRHSSKPEISTKVSSRMINTMVKEPFSRQIIPIQVILRTDYLTAME